MLAGDLGPTDCQRSVLGDRRVSIDFLMGVIQICAGVATSVRPRLDFPHKRSSC